MAWVVDTCLVIDVLDADPDFGGASAELLEARTDAGLVLCPVSFVELAPAFLGDLDREKHFLREINVDFAQPWTWPDTVSAFEAWHRYVRQRRAGRVARRPIADVQIGAFAVRHEGVLTRNGDDYRRLFPELAIIEPAP